MPELNFVIIILLAAVVGLLFIFLLIAAGIQGRLGRIERLLVAKSDAMPAVSQPLAEISSGGIFEAFLKEDPARKLLSKKEQSAAYRLWRQEKNMNWSNS